MWRHFEFEIKKTLIFVNSTKIMKMNLVSKTLGESEGPGNLQVYTVGYGTHENAL